MSTQGITILRVQNAKLALRATHRGYAMGSSLIIMEDRVPQMLEAPRETAAYLGGVRLYLSYNSRRLTA